MTIKHNDKLKCLKGDLKEWNRNMFGDLDCRIEELVERLKELDLKAEVGMLSIEDKEAKSKGFVDL